MRRVFFVFLFFVLFNTPLHSQKFSLGVNFLGPTYSAAGVFTQTHLNENFTFEFGTDIRSIYGGIIVFPFRSSTKEEIAAPYTGALLTHTNNILFSVTDGMKVGLTGYFPIGVKIFPERRINISFEISVNTDYVYEFGNLFGAIKLSYLINQN